MITDPAHFSGIVRPTASNGRPGAQDQFLAMFPHTEAFVQGVVRLKGGNATYHLAQVLSLTDSYPISTVTAAIQRATEYGAFAARSVRRICETESALALGLPNSPVQSSQPALLQVPVEECTLVQYAETAPCAVGGRARCSCSLRRCASCP